MAKEFDEAVRKLTDLRLQKSVITTQIYQKKQGIIANQYLLNTAINTNQDGKAYLTQINSYKTEVKSLNEQLGHTVADESRLIQELGGIFGGFNNLVDQLNDRYPILFFPVRVETAFSEESGRQLWVRIFPDDIAVNTHEEDLTESEIAEGKLYWERFVIATSDVERVHAWDLLCRSFGSERAAWITLQLTPTNPGSNLPDFPVLTPKADSWSKQPVTNIMPDAFVIYAYDYDGNVISHQTNAIPDELKMGIDPSLDPDMEEMSFDQTDVNGLQNDLKAAEDVNWMINFDIAIENGLGAKIGINDDQYARGFKKILILGVKSSLSINDSKQRLEALINGHHYTDGFSLLKQGTSTNNTDTEYAGYTFKEFTNKVTNDTERDNALFSPVYIQRQKKDGQVLCEALGIDYETLYHIFQANGSDISDAMNMNTVLYQVSFGYYANELMPIFGGRTSNNTALKNFFSDYVRSRGALPSIRSGTQPYGILPASVLSRINWDTDPNAGLYRNIFQYTQALDRHWTNAIASIGFQEERRADDKFAAAQQLSDVMSLHALSTEYVQRVGLGAGYIWNNLEYAATKYPEQRDRWLHEQMAQIDDRIRQSGLGIKADNRAVQINYLREHSKVTIPVVADENLPLDAPLPEIEKSRKNMLELLYLASFDQLRDEDFQEYGISKEGVDKYMRNNLLYRMTRQSLMLEYYEAACELLHIPEEQRRENELVNIVGQVPTAFVTDADAAPAGPMGNLSYGQSRLQVMAQPYGDYPSIGQFLRSDQAQQYGEVQQLVAARASLLTLSRANVRELNLLATGVIDASAYRLDTWRLALVNQRLNSLRGITEGSSSRITGLYLGAYGWVTDVVRNSTLTNVPTPDGFDGSIMHDDTNKGYIHAPSINQAVNGAVMRSGYTDRANVNMKDPLSVNLSSERVRNALDILEAIRNGQQLGVLLGYELERRLHDLYPLNANLDSVIMRLRRYYSQDNTIIETTPQTMDRVKARNVINGVQLVEEFKNNQMTAIAPQAEVIVGSAEYNALRTEIEWIWNLMDATGDVAMSEGMFHIVQGNPVKGGAITQAISKGNLIAEPDVVNTIKTGTEVNQRFTMHFSPDTAIINGWGAIPPTPRSLAEPYINKWLTEVLPDPVNIHCLIEMDGFVDLTSVTIRKLGLQAIDLLYLVTEELNNDDAQLSLIIKRYYRKLNGIDKRKDLIIHYDAPITGNFSMQELLPVLLYARKVITASRHLDTHDYMVPAEADGALKIYNAAQFESRINAARTGLQTAKTSLEAALSSFTFNGVNDALYAFSAFGIEETAYEFYDDDDPEDEDMLRSWAASVLGIAEQRLTESDIGSGTVPAPGTDADAYIRTALQRFKAIFGNSFSALPLFEIRPQEQSYLSLMVSYSSTLLDDHLGNDLLTDEWLCSIAKVRSNAANFELLTVLSSCVNFDAFYSRPIRALQIPYASDTTERWLGASVNASGLKSGRVAIGASMPHGHLVSGEQVGILIDDWIDVIPNQEETTGIGFHHNQPNAKAPQCLVLGLTPQITGNWQWNDLVDMMNETFDLALKRGLDYESLSNTVVGQLHPTMVMPFTQSGNVIGLSAQHVLNI